MFKKVSAAVVLLVLAFALSTIVPAAYADEPQKGLDQSGQKHFSVEMYSRLNCKIKAGSSVYLYKLTWSKDHSGRKFASGAKKDEEKTTFARDRFTGGVPYKVGFSSYVKVNGTKKYVRTSSCACK